MKRSAGAVVLALAAWSAAAVGDDELFTKEARAFLSRVDADRAALMAVQYKGRIAVLDTLARDLVRQTCGAERPAGLTPAVAFLELYFNAGEYLARPLVYVRERNMRKFVAGHLDKPTRETFEQTHRLPPDELINEDAALALLRTGRASLDQCAPVAEPSRLSRALAGLAAERPEFRVPVDRLQSRMSAFLAVGVFRPLPLSDAPAWALAEEVLFFDAQLPGSGMPTSLAVEHRLFRPWLAARRRGDHAEAALLADMLRKTLEAVEEVRRRRMARGAVTAPATAPASTQPSTAQATEDDKYLAPYEDFVRLRDAWRARDAEEVNALLAKLDADVAAAVGRRYPSPTARRLELWYNRTYSGTIVWIGFAVALVLFILAAAIPQQRVLRLVGLSVLGLSAAAMVGGFVLRWVVAGRAWYLPPIMNQFEAVVGSAMLASAFALVLELITKRNYFALSAAFYATVSLLCGFFLPEQIGAQIKAQHGILASPIMAVHVAVIIVGHALVGMTFVLSVAYVGVVTVRGLSVEPRECSASPDLTARPRPTALASIDRCNLIVAQLACWSVAAGTILGAYWADFAWARWWGWDRKETWALITTLVYVVVLHVRFVTPPRWRGTVTALGCIVGCGVMLFNWIVVNYLLPGLHSYA